MLLPNNSENTLLESLEEFSGRLSVLNVSAEDQLKIETSRQTYFALEKDKAIHESLSDEDETSSRDISEAITAVFNRLSDGQRKDILYVRVDGSSDEGPVHKEVQFLWTEKTCHGQSLMHCGDNKALGWILSQLCGTNERLPLRGTQQLLYTVNTWWTS